MLLITIHDQLFIGLLNHAVLLMKNHFRTRYGEFVAFPAHGFNQH